MFARRYFSPRYWADRYWPHVGATAPTSIRRIAVEETFAWQRPVLSFLDTPPASPTKGDRYIVAATATGDWAGHEDDLAWRYNAEWKFDTPHEGWTAFNRDDSAVYTFIGGAWTATMGGAGLGIVRRAVVTLDDAAIKTLTTPVLVAAAPGASKRSQLLSATISTFFDNGAYTNIDASAWGAFAWPGKNDFSSYLVNDPVLGRADVSALLGTPKRNLCTFRPWMDDDPAGWGSYEHPFADMGGVAVNQPIEFYIDNNGAGDFTGGHALNTMRIAVYYTIEDL